MGSHCHNTNFLSENYCFTKTYLSIFTEIDCTATFQGIFKHPHSPDSVSSIHMLRQSHRLPLKNTTTDMRVCLCVYVCMLVSGEGGGEVKIFLTQYNRQGTIWQTGSKLFILILFGG